MIIQREDYKDFDGHLEITSGEDLEIDFSSEQCRAIGEIIDLILAVRGRDNFGLERFSLSQEYITEKAEEELEEAT